MASVFTTVTLPSKSGLGFSSSPRNGQVLIRVRTRPITINLRLETAFLFLVLVSHKAITFNEYSETDISQTGNDYVSTAFNRPKQILEHSGDWILSGIKSSITATCLPFSSVGMTTFPLDRIGSSHHWYRKVDSIAFKTGRCVVRNTGAWRHSACFITFEYETRKRLSFGTVRS